MSFQKGKGRERKKEGKEKKIFPFAMFRYRKERKEENVRILHFLWFAKKRDRKNVCF